MIFQLARYRLTPSASKHKVQTTMKIILQLFCALGVLAFNFNNAWADSASTDESGSRLTIELRDGSRVVGKSLDDTLAFHSSALGDMKLSWAGIRAIEYIT